MTNSPYSGLSYSRDELARAMRAAYDELIDFVTTPEFSVAMDELGALPSHERPAFVLSVFLDSDERANRGIQPSEGILIQRSAFGDRRPTLFCVKKYLPDELSDAWQNVNLTFDNEYLDESVSRSPEVAWREPLPVHLQAEAMARAQPLENVS